ncbi:MAG: hypothetical protein J6Y32_08725 [Bacteroidales bacterium]|nr:hypothetical protein [Bacteroidales bacterium]
MKRILYRILCLAPLSVLLLSGSCSKYNPFDSYWHEGFEREDQGGKPGRGGLFDDGYGTEESPYGLCTPQHMKNISRGLVEGDMVYFRMKNDIDMDGESWSALNPNEPYSKFIDFDGGGHIILNLTVTTQKYGSFFGVLCGACHDVGFYNATVQSSNAGGVIGGYVGLAGPADDTFTGRVERVYVTGTVVASSGSNAGGICGELGKMVDMTPCVISDCYTIVDVSGAHTGGLAGQVRSGSKIERSYACGNVMANKDAEKNFYGGGLVGNLNGGILSDCIAWNSGVSGKTVGYVYGNKVSGSSVSNAYYFQDIALSGNKGNEDDVQKKSTAELQAIVGAWSAELRSNWSATLTNGKPILNWQFARGDYAEYSGHGGEVGPLTNPGFAGGNGTQNDPFIVDSLRHLRSMHPQYNLMTPGHEYWVKLGKDIDAKLLPAWDPLNIQSPYSLKIHFDGANHKISNLKMGSGTYSSFFGVLNGECKDVIFEKCTVSQNSKSTCGIVGAFAGSGSTITATVSNVKVTGASKISTTGAAPCGMLFGVAANATITGCEVSGTVNSQNSSTSSGEQGAAGIAGRIENGSTITGCTNNCVINGVRLIGGIAGYAKGAISITNCTNTGNVTSSAAGSAVGERVGGIVGHLDPGGRVTFCTNGGIIKAEKNVGGIVGLVEACNSNTVISKCCSTGDVSAVSGDHAGGICAYMYAGEINNCWSSGTIQATGGKAGGIVGNIKSGNLNSTYTNTTGKVINCYSKASVSAARCASGIVGMASHDGWNATATAASAISDITVTGCIAWNGAIRGTSMGLDSGSSGAIVGYTYIKNTLNNCWRKGDMTFSSYEGNTLIDQDAVSASAPLAKQGSDANTNCYAYHAKAAAAGNTISNLAVLLNWDTGIWNLSGSEPTLK